MVDVALVLVLRPIGEQGHTHILDAILQVLLLSVELVQHASLFFSGDHPGARGTLVHLNLSEGLLTIKFLFLAEPTEVSWDLGDIFGLKLLFFLFLRLSGHHINLFLHLN